MNVVAIPNGRFLENCYLVVDPPSGECAVIDPGEATDLIAHKVAALGVRPVAIWLTHAHVDHVVGVTHLKQGLPAPDRTLAHGDAVHVGGLTFQVRHTPGHSPGGVSFVGHGAVFVGDVLFQGSIGRTDLPGGDFDTLIRSIERELLSLPDDTIVYSGHGLETTVGRERRHNPFLTGAYRLA